MWRFLSVAMLAVVSQSVAAAEACPTKNVQDCASIFAQSMSENLKNGPLVSGEFTLESVVATRSEVTLTHRASFTESDFNRYLSLSKTPIEQYLAVVRSATIQHDCRDPAASVVALGASFKNVFHFKDGGVLDEVVVSSCPVG
jgi:hypothetical protein